MDRGEHAPMRQRDLHIWPRYEAATLGFRNYWYPVTWSRKVGSKPVSVRMLGDPVMVRREQGRIHAFYDQCPHRGIPLSVGRQEFPGTWSCRYHGWTYDCETGVLRAALTDGPDSPICGKVRVKTYPVEERAGLVWAWMGEGPPSVPVEADIPEELLAADAAIVGRSSVREGNWRLAAENGYDEGHVAFLHRYGAFWTLLSRLPAYFRSPQGGTQDGPWLQRRVKDVGVQGDYPGLGTWPRFAPWQRGNSPAYVSIRMPGILQVRAPTHVYHAWYVPIDENSHNYFQIMLRRGNAVARWKFKAVYWLQRRWLNAQFTGQDTWMIRLMPMTAPERLYRPDASITAWRRLCEHARGEGTADAAPEPEAAPAEQRA
jgi:phenylpropionate dioxygenase-like ring-hydroxylating dioxygenase large terminal subunit